MKKMQIPTEGGCLCGSIRFKAKGPEKGSGYCHCGSCRQHTGSLVAAYVVFEATDIEWTFGERSQFESSPSVFRSFCSKCGASIAFEDYSHDKAIIEFNLSSLDAPHRFKPTEHTCYDERLPWVNFLDNLPKLQDAMKIE